MHQFIQQIQQNIDALDVKDINGNRLLPDGWHIVDTRKDNVVVLLSLKVGEHTVDAKWWGQVNGQVKSHEWEPFDPEKMHGEIASFLLQNLADSPSESMAVE